MSARFTTIIPDDAGPRGPFSFEGVETSGVNFHLRFDWKRRPEHITIKNVTTGEEIILPVLPCGCVGECACSASEVIE